MRQVFVGLRRLRRTTMALAAALTAVVVTSAHAQQSPLPSAAPSIADRVRIDTRRPIDFHAYAWPDTVYLGQQVDYQVGVFLSESAQSRLRRNPEFEPPELRGLMAYELIMPRRIGNRDVGGRSYMALVFHRALFPVMTGDIVVLPPRLNYSLPTSSSYFSREESFVVRAESLTVVVRDLPEAGRPIDFTGAVGRFRASARIDNDRPRAGDPLVLTLRVEGMGNIKLLSRPLLEIEWATLVPGTERLSIDSTGLVVRGYKEFEWILTPTRDGDVALPPLRYAYFDPYLGAYQVTLTDSTMVAVQPGNVVAGDEAEGTSLLPLRESIGDASLLTRFGRTRHLLPDGLWFTLFALSPVPAVLLLLRRPTARRAPLPVAPAADLLALAGAARPPLARADPSDPAAEAGRALSDEARAVRRALHRALAARLGVHVQQLTDRRQVVRLLRRSGATRDTVARTVQLLEQLDRAGFAAQPELVRERFAVPAHQVFEQIEAETLAPGHRLRARITRIVDRTVRGASMMFLLSTPPLGMQDEVAAPRDDAVVAEFTAARDAYRQRQFTDATARFAALAARHPGAPDILANWGTAAWASGDTVGAVLGWQRAARLDPLATDLQERMRLLPPGARGGIAEVPLVPVDALLTLGGALWIGGWMLVAAAIAHHRRRGRPSRALRAIGVLVVAAGVAAFGVGLVEAQSRDASSLMVVTRPETMRERGSGDSDAMGGVATGDIVRRVDADREWIAVQHSDGRNGWLPASRLVPLMPLAGRSLEGIDGAGAGDPDRQPYRGGE